MSIADNKARYEGSAMQALMKASGHTICERCYCCDATYETYPCWGCGGFPFDEDDDDEWATPCTVCGGEGEMSVLECIGRCDDEGNHKKKEVAA